MTDVLAPVLYGLAHAAFGAIALMAMAYVVMLAGKLETGANAVRGLVHDYHLPLLAHHHPTSERPYLPTRSRDPR